MKDKQREASKVPFGVSRIILFPSLRYPFFIQVNGAESMDS